MRYGIIIAGVVAFVAVAAYTVLRSPETDELERADTGLFSSGGLSDDATAALDDIAGDSGEAELATDIGAESDAVGGMNRATATQTEGAAGDTGTDGTTAMQTGGDTAAGMGGGSEMQTANPDSSLAGGATEGVTPPTDLGTANFQPGEGVAQTGDSMTEDMAREGGDMTAGGDTATADTGAATDGSADIAQSGDASGTTGTDGEATASAGGADMTDPETILAAEEEEAEPFEAPQTALTGGGAADTTQTGEGSDTGAMQTGAMQTGDAAATAGNGSESMQSGEAAATAQGTTEGGMDDPGADPSETAYGDTAGTDPSGEDLDTSTAEGPSAETLQSLSETGAASEKATAAAQSAAANEQRSAEAAQDTAREAADNLGTPGAEAGTDDGGELAERVEEMEQRIEDSDLSGERQRELLTALREVADDPEALREELERIAREADL